MNKTHFDGNPKNGCIYLLSARDYLIEECIESLYDNYNKNFNFPVYVYYFGDIYDSSEIKTRIENTYDATFVKIIPSVPKHISEKELFYYRDNNYAKLFGRGRMNYLHMEDFVCNIHARTELLNYQFHHRIDDDSLFCKEINYNLFEKLLDKNSPMGTSHLWSNINQNIYDVREELFDFYMTYIKHNNIVPKYNELKNAVLNHDEKGFHLLPWSSGNCNIYNQNYFLNDSRWNHWINSVNEFGGTYKHRWGDQEIIGLYTYTFFENSIVNLRLDENGIYQSQNRKAKMIIDNTNPNKINRIFNLIKSKIIKK